MDMDKQLPRLTRYLRAFTNLEPRKQHAENASLKPLDHISENKPLERVHTFLWSDLLLTIDKYSCMTPIVSKRLKYLQNLAKDICGEQFIVGETAIYLFQLFMHERKALNKHCSILKLMYSNISFNQVEKICAVVNEIVDELTEECVASIGENLKEPKEKESLSGNKCKMWGNHIKFQIPASWIPPDTSFLADLTNEQNITQSFSMAYSENGDTEKKIDNKKSVFGKSWMVKEVEKCNNSNGLTTDEICNTVTSLLISNRTNDALQNELFDFLGFDNFEFIQSLLEHRKEICMSNKLEEKRKSSASSDSKQKPFVATVTVKSQEEIYLEKQARKEEKKLTKFAAKEAKTTKEEPQVYEERFDPIELRAKRIAALTTPVTNDFSSENKKVSVKKEVYPHVYDSLSVVQQQCGYVSGVKMMLPENVKKVDNKQYEEVNIPILPPTPLNVGSKLIPISTLDEYGQLAFSGVTNLNRIQSVVFETAYRTNENLLICAPTGAGKTNIALLTVMRTIRQFIENGVIKKDQFKIVYVAPMKALAAEMTGNFSKKLSALGIVVRELTGDMQLTKSEIFQTQMLVTTPEKWDVVTRKGTGDVALTRIVKLLIIDEVHLLHGDRGPVVEALVARTLRQVESSQSMIRIVGLSATLPNYIDVAKFLHVNPQVGLFYFDSRFRPVPLEQTFIGVKAIKTLQQISDMDSVCYEKLSELVQHGHQVMVFVHARNATVRTANVLIEMARQKNQLGMFQPEDGPAVGNAAKAFGKARSKELAELFTNGFSVHHAGLLRADRSLVEKYFAAGLIKVLVCTATLAWGVNLPAHAVIIRGTEIYDSKHGTFIDLGILDVLQIFGRAGRPQFDTSGHGIIITAHNKLAYYLSLLTNQFPIESNFVNFLADNLNAEISSGTVSNIDEAVEWLSYTYLYVRMRINPQVYGLNYKDVLEDPNLDFHRRELITVAAKALDKVKMVRFNVRTGDLSITDLGRIASHYYIKYDTVEVFNEMLTATMHESEILSMVSHSQEFQQLKVRDDEMDELEELVTNHCEYEVKGGKENLHGKVNILMQTYLSRYKVNSFSLMSDLSYISQNAVRIIRALFEINLRRNNSLLAGRFLQMALMMEHQQWNWETPLRQFSILPFEIINKIEQRDLSVETLREMDSKEIGILLRHSKMGVTVKRCAYEFPFLDLSASLHPITRTVLRIRLTIAPNFTWNDKVHGKTSESYWIWIEDPGDTNIYHSEYFIISRKQVIHREPQELVMTVPLADPIPAQYIIRMMSDRWLGCSNSIAISVENLILPESHPPHTELLDLQPLPVTALNNSQFENLYKFSYFNPIQTQVFHCLYHTDNNVLLGAPTGSGKTIMAEIAMFRVFQKFPECKVVYVAPLKALVRERIEDWKIRFEKLINKTVVELTGDTSPDIQAIMKSDVIVTTPEKWDSISRSWQTRGYVQKVTLIVLDEVHLLGEDRGPVLEVIVSRTNFISSHTDKPIRIIALSTALANARDLANWLGIKEMGLYNFRPSVRPVPLEVHINGFPGKLYCPRMATMNKPVFQAILQHSPAQPALVFVSSRRQTRLTALDLIAYLASENNPKQWMHTTEEEMDQIITTIRDTNLRLTLAFGIGLHHAGLQERDRKTVEELFTNQKIQVLIATATLAWGVNLPAHLVVVKGTEYYDGKTKRYIDMPVTDVLQMMGRAGRPQFDNQGVAVILVHDVKKNFYKKFLYEPFPVESSLLEVLPDHLNAEIVAGTIKTKQEALDYLTWTYFFRRLLKNPTYYGLESLDSTDINKFLSNLLDKTLLTLYYSGCLNMDDDERGVSATSIGRIASYYYLSFQTMHQLHDNLKSDLSLEKCLFTMCHVYEYSQIPVRHNEEILNGDLAKSCPWPVDPLQLDSPHIKTYLLLQAHFSRLELPCTDYYTDLKSILDQAIRILQGMLDVSGECGWLALSLRLQNLMQMVMQGRWLTDSPFTVLPHVEPFIAMSLHKKCLNSLPKVVHAARKGYSAIANHFMPELDEGQIEQIYQVLKSFPILRVTIENIGGINVIENEAVQESCNPKNHELVIGEQYSLSIILERLNKPTEKRAYAPKFHKPKSEGWVLTLGDIEGNELLALRRVAFTHKTNVHLVFYPPERKGPCIITLYVMSDTYLGLDQQYDFEINVLENKENISPCIETS